MDLITWSLILAALVLLSFYYIEYFTYWKRRGVPCAKGLKPFFGHLWPVFTMAKSSSQIVYQMYTEYKNYSMVGLHFLNQPVLLLREPGLLKTVMQTSFSSFHQNGMKIDPELDPLMSRNPFVLTGEEWANGRKRLTYAFSSMRLKILFQSVFAVTKKFDNYIKRKMEGTGKYEVELKDLFSRFTGEVVANAGLGVEGFCFDDNPNGQSFQKLGKEFLDPSFSNTITITFVLLFPFLAKVFRLRFIPKKVDRFFRDIVRDVMSSRKTEAVSRNDFFQLMMDLEKTEGEKFDENTLAAHALSFFVDGYESSSITLSFAGYQLAANPDVQEKLREEITRVLSKYDNVLTYDALKEMTYMDQVISESQRLHPVLGHLTKVCTQEYELRGSDGMTCKVKPGTQIIVPLFGMHWDSKYWSNPDVFDPERFSSERKKDIERFAFLPFGEGPRVCVGMRMGLLQTKACLAALLKDYSLELSPKTQQPLQLAASSFLTAPVGGIWVNIKPL